MPFNDTFNDPIFIHLMKDKRKIMSFFTSSDYPTHIFLAKLFASDIEKCIVLCKTFNILNFYYGHTVKLNPLLFIAM